MARYLVQPRDQIFVKAMNYYLLLKIGVKILQKHKKLSGKYSQNLPDHAKQSATNAFKTASRREIKTGAKATGDLIGSTIVNKITKVSKNFTTK